MADEDASSPPEAFRRAWRFIIEPKHSNALVAIFTIFIFVSGVIYCVVAALQWSAMRESNAINREALIASQRPWVKIKQRIIKPLTFDVGGRAGGPIAAITLEDTLENVGQSVAVNVFSWEDVIPMDPDFSTTTARARQKQWCDANRHPDPKGLQWIRFVPTT